MHSTWSRTGPLGRPRLSKARSLFNVQDDVVVAWLLRLDNQRHGGIAPSVLSASMERRCCTCCRHGDETVIDDEPVLQLRRIPFRLRNEGPYVVPGKRLGSA